MSKTQIQFESDLKKAQNEFNEIVGACFLFLKANTNYSDLEIISGLQVSLAEVVEEIKERVSEN